MAFIRRQFDPDALVVFAATDRGQGLTFARSRDTFAVLDQKQCAMCGALDQAGAAVEELICLPFQANAPMRAAIPVDEHLSLTAYCQQCVFTDCKPSTMCLGQLTGGAKESQGASKGDVQ